MDIIALLVVAGILLLFALLIYAMVRAVRKDREKKAQAAQALGFSAVESDAALLDKITSAYGSRQHRPAYRLQNLFRKVILDGEMLVFDLDDTGGDETSQVETQAVAVISPQLQMPQFGLYPQADMEGWAVNLANKAMRFAAGKTGTLLEFPEHPDFEKRYLLTSTEAEEARRFFDAQVLEQLAQTRYLNVQGRGDIFILSSMDPSMRSKEQNTLADRVGKAMQMFRILQQGRGG